MKKIFTLIFSLGVLTAAFAQEGGRHQRDYNSQSQSYGYQDHQRYGQDQTYQATPYSNQWSYTRRDEGRHDWQNRYEEGNDLRDRGYGYDRFGMERHRHVTYWRRHRHGLFFRFGGY